MEYTANQLLMILPLTFPIMLIVIAMTILVCTTLVMIYYWNVFVRIIRRNYRNVVKIVQIVMTLHSQVL